MADKCIGKLTLDISDVSKKIEDINKFLGQIGANINLEDKLSKKISAALKNLVNEAKKAGEESARAMEQGVSASAYEKMEQKVLAAENKMRAEADKTLAQMEKRAEREAAAAERSAERQRAAYEKAQRQHEETFRKAEFAAERQAKKEEAAAERATQKTLQMYTQMFDKRRQQEEKEEKRAQAAQEKTVQMYTQMFDKLRQQEEKQIAEATQAYIKLEEAQANRRVVYKQQGGNDSSDEYIKATRAVQEAKAAFDKFDETIQDIAKDSDEAKAAVSRITTMKEGLVSNAEKKEAEEAAAAYAKLAEARSKLNIVVAKNGVESEEYVKAAKNVSELEEKFNKFGNSLKYNTQQQYEASEAAKILADAERNVINTFDQQKQGDKFLADAKQKYFELTDAIKNYNAEKSKGNELGMATEQARIDKIMEEVGILEEAVRKSNLEEDAKRRILNITQQCTTAENQHVGEMNRSADAAKAVANQLTGILMQYVSLTAVIRTVSSLISNMVEYVTEYSNKMNEIQIITMKTDDEVKDLAETYRNLAADMNVSSLDMADAAIYFTRQGLGAKDIEDRLKNVTMYAKAANVEFKDASEIITAVVNSMGLVEQEAEDGRTAAQRVADVFLNIGDNAATSGQEIGEAMQKAAASAGAFGVSMEWLAAYIATVSETTRQEARTIGTAFNTIIARLHQIKQTGYNQEDTTKVNDIAKALSKIDVALMDQFGNWRDMEVILEEIADKWGELDGKTKSYIATTMAGVKQQNVFLALMNDMSKKAEDNSRAYELYAKAMDSAGVAEEKYAVYKDSVTAAQERLNIAQEKFYSLLNDTAIKGWYDMLAGVVTYITEATDAFSGLNIILPLIAGGVAVVAVALRGLAAAAAEAHFASLSLASVWATNPMLLIVAGVAGAIALLTALSHEIDRVNESSARAFENANKRLEESQSNLEKYYNAQKKATGVFDEFGSKTNHTTKEIEEYNSMLDEMSKLSPVAKHVVDELKAGFISQEEAAKKLNDELERLIENEKTVSMHNIMQRYANYQSSEKNTRDISLLSRQWDTGAYSEIGNSEQRFRNILATQYGLGNLSKELTDRIKESIASYMKADMSVDEAWDTLAADIMYEMFDSFTMPDDLSKKLADEVEQEIDYVMSVVGKDLDMADYAVVRQGLFDALFGDDGQLSNEEYAKFSKVIASFLRNFAKDGVEGIKSEYSDIDIAKIVAETIFGPGTMGDVFEIAEANSAGFAKEFVDSISELIAGGLSNDQIKDILSETPQMYWNEIANTYRTNLENALKEAFGDDTLGDLIPLFNDNGDLVGFDVDELLWGELDFPTLQKILDMANSGVITLDQVNAMMNESGSSVDTFKSKLDNFAKESGFEEEVEEETEAVKDLQKELDNAIKQVDKFDSILDKLRGGKKIDFDDLVDLATAHPEIMSVIDDTQALIEMIERLRGESLDKFGESYGDLLWNSPEAAASIAKSQGYDLQEGETMADYRARLELNHQTQEADQVAQFIQGMIDALIQAREEYDASTEAWLDAQAEKIQQQQELNAAESEGFTAQTSSMQAGLGLGGEEGAQKALDTFNALNASMKESYADAYPGVIKAASNLEKVMKNEARTTEDVEQATKALDRELAKAQTYATAKHFKDTYNAARQLEQGTISVADAYDALDKEANNLSKAYEDILDVEDKLGKKTNVTASDVSNLSKVLNMSADDILADWPEAVNMFDELTGATGEFQAALDALNAAAFIRITGVSEADFSNIENGLFAVRADAEDVIKMLEATGQWEVVDIPLEQTAKVWDAVAKKWSTLREVGNAKVLKPTGNNPFSRSTAPRTSNSRSGGGGGGGGGSSNNNNKETNDSFRDRNITTEVEKMLDLMKQINDIQQQSLNYYQAMQQYYQSTGQLQGVIGYMGREKDALEDQNKTLEQNVKRIEEQIAAKQAELKSLSPTDEKYKEVADDLEKLQNAYYQYTQQLIQNKTAINNLNKSIEEQQKKIRQMEIDLENEILQAILDREQKRKDMLNAEIQMENTIMDIIKRRYEKERDQIIETTNLKIESLQNERDLLSEQLQLRKEQAEQEDKAKRLYELEQKYQRIVADPTRAKEAQKIQQEIDDLRTEMAWDTAENEVKAQQESIDQQIESLEDYIEYVQKYYEDLFEHPKKLINETKKIMKMSQDEIIEWLKKNDENYQKATKNTQKQMEQSWRETHDKMKGKVKTYWDEVQSIIAKGDDYIIKFLKKNSKKYAEASQKQAQAYVDEWKKALNDLKKAHEEVATQIANTYPPVPQGDGGSGSGSGSGSNGGSSGSRGGSRRTSTGKTTITTGNNGGVIDPKSPTGPGSTGSRINQAFATGGIADFSGPAWLDGSPQDPERVLSPYQTKLFETMVRALERMSTIYVPSMSNMSGLVQTGANPVSVGDIIVNVDNLDTDDDYEELARKVGEVLMDEIGRTTVVGGLRIRSV